MAPIGDAGQSLFPEPIPTAPKLEFSYEFITRLERIGRGGNADVYKVLVQTDDREHVVAIKEPRFQQETLHRGVIEAFIDEAETWANLDSHDHIVDVIEWDSAPLPWIALEYMDGGSLRQRIDTIDVQEALLTGINTATAIRYAHRHGVVHLDLKPENILFRQTEDEYRDVPKVSDWGLARLLLNQSQSVEGISPRYAAPEQFDPATYGNPDDFTDIYQLGVVMYEVLTGAPPFTGSATAVMRATLEEQPPPPTSKHPDLPEDTDEILAKALAKRKTNRYESVLDLRRALEDLAEAVEPSNGPTPGKDGLPEISRGDRLRADAEDHFDAEDYGRAIAAYEQAREAYEDALDAAMENERLDADQIQRRTDEIKEDLGSARRQRLSEQLDSVRSRLDHAETLVEDDNIDEAKDELETLRSRLSELKNSTAEYGFDDLQDEASSLQQRCDDRLEEIPYEWNVSPISHWREFVETARQGRWELIWKPDKLFSMDDLRVRSVIWSVVLATVVSVGTIMLDPYSPPPGDFVPVYVGFAIIGFVLSQVVLSASRFYNWLVENGWNLPDLIRKPLNVRAIDDLEAREVAFGVVFAGLVVVGATALQGFLAGSMAPILFHETIMYTAAFLFGGVVAGITGSLGTFVFALTVATLSPTVLGLTVVRGLQGYIVGRVAGETTLSKVLAVAAAAPIVIVGTVIFGGGLLNRIIFQIAVGLAVALPLVKVLQPRLPEL